VWMHGLVVASHPALHVLAVGRGIFIWLMFRTITHALGWPITIALFAAIAVGATLYRQRRSP
jgi:hypothetical protein